MNTKTEHGMTRYETYACYNMERERIAPNKVGLAELATLLGHQTRTRHAAEISAESLSNNRTPCIQPTYYREKLQNAFSKASSSSLVIGYVCSGAGYALDLTSSR